MASRTTSSHALLFHLLAASSVCSCGLALLVTQVETSASTTAQVQPAAGAQATPAAALGFLLARVAEAPAETPPPAPQRLSARGREAGELSGCC